ncbi:MAG: PDDEXK nuclease domain-containing protein [Bacteroidales bacterium]|nr:PDDEXK nuclease domain-containing protein [Bacteroidales bacterium]
MNNEMKPTDLFKRIAGLLQSARQNVVRTINQTMVYTYFEIGRMIVEDEQQGQERAEYGKGVLKELSVKLRAEFGKGFSVQNLENMRKFYLLYAVDTKSQSLIRISENSNFTLSWTHYLVLIRIEKQQERNFYEIEALNNNWSVRELKRQFDSALYERLALSRDKKGVKQLAEEGQIIQKPTDILKDPYVLEFLNLPEQEQYSESDLETAIIDKLEQFLLELGKGFTFVARQFRMTIDEKHYKADLVFFNRLLKCFVVIDLKIGELTHQDIGQMQMYVHFHDRNVKLPEENKTIGIILCKQKSNVLVKLTLPENNDQIFASRYQMILPDKQTFIKLLNETEV